MIALARFCAYHGCGMRFYFAAIPVCDSATAEAELNRFLGSHRVLAVDRQLVVDGARSLWAVCVSYVDREVAPAGARPSPPAAAQTAAPPAKALRKGIDYREVLSPADFEVFARLRVVRKGLAERDGVPAYAIFTNEQLAAIARGRAQSVADLGRVPGVGKARVEKYGPVILAGVRGEAADDADTTGSAPGGEHAA